MEIDECFLGLAKTFSESFKRFKNEFTLNSKECEWELVYTIETPALARVSSQRKRIEINCNLSNHEAVTNNFMFYLLVWCYIEKYTEDTIESDNKAIKYYRLTGRPMKDVALGTIDMLQDIPSHYIVERLENLREQLGFEVE